MLKNIVANYQPLNHEKIQKSRFVPVLICLSFILLLLILISKQVSKDDSSNSFLENIITRQPSISHNDDLHYNDDDEEVDQIEEEDEVIPTNNENNNDDSQKEEDEEIDPKDEVIHTLTPSTISDRERSDDDDDDILLNDNQIPEEKIETLEQEFDQMNFEPTKMPENHETAQELFWEFNFTAQSKPRIHPNLVFIKGLKVGGTSVSYALNRAAQTYGISLSKVPAIKNGKIFEDDSRCSKTRGSLYFHHGFKNAWQEHCIPHVKYVTILRDPIDQSISWENFVLNRDYYLQYPQEECSQKRFIEINSTYTKRHLENLLGQISNCKDTPYRTNITIMLVAHSFLELHTKDPGLAVGNTLKWSLARYFPSFTSSEETISIFKLQYTLVGVTERLNEFLVLLALTNGWDLSSVYYRKCKETDVRVSTREFSKMFPNLVSKLKISTKQMKDAYEWAKKNFDEHVKKLGSWFPKLVKKYEEGLLEFQSGFKHHEGFKWQRINYLDDEFEYC